MNGRNDAAEAARQREYISKIAAMISGEDLKYMVVTFGCQMNERDSEKIAGALEQMGYSKAEARMPKEEKMLLNIDEAFNLLGYDDEIIARLTFRELVCIPGVDYEIAEYIIDVVKSKYKDLYHQPKVVLKTRDDIRQMTNLFFAAHK